MKASTKQKVKSTILKVAKNSTKRELAATILLYYNLHISHNKPVGSEISVNVISKEFGINIGTETAVEINKLLFISQMVSIEEWASILFDLTHKTIFKNTING